MKVQTIVGSIAIAAVAVGCATVKDGQTGDAATNIGTVAADGEYVPGLQQGVFEGLGRQTAKDFASLLKCGKTCADAGRLTHTLGTILADVDRSYEVMNELTGKNEMFFEGAAVLYEGEIYMEGGTQYNFFAAIDNWASIEIDGELILKGGIDMWWRGECVKEGSRLFGSKVFEKSGWHSLRVWLADGGGPRGSLLGVAGMGIGWTMSGCKELNASNFSQWHPLRDDGSGRFLRTKRLPRKSEAKAATEKSGN